MENFNLEALNKFWLDFQQSPQQPLVWLGLAVAGLLLLWLVVRIARRSGKVLPPSAPEQRPESEVSDSVLEQPATEEVAAPIAPVEPEQSLAQRFKRGLSKTRQNFSQLFVAGQAIDDELLEELETHLLMADVGIEVTQQVLDELTEQVSQNKLSDPEALQQALRQILLDILQPCESSLTPSNTDKPQVMLVVGVNGVGKTTTIGKLAKRLQTEGNTVMLAAGDTFRAAAVEQLQVWGERNNVPVVAQHTGADSASVIFDAIQSAQARGIDWLIADTAGRLHNKSNLMEELKKVTRVMAKLDENAPHEVLLVLDAGTGQNALSQMQGFHKAVGITGIALTKLDGTAKGGVIFPLCKRFGVPVRFVGVGEGVDDLQPFVATDFVDALFDKAQH